MEAIVALNADGMPILMVEQHALEALEFRTGDMCSWRGATAPPAMAGPSPRIRKSGVSSSEDSAVTTPSS